MRRTVVLVVLGIVLNVVAGTVVTTLKLPVFLDAIGTIVVTLGAGLLPGLVTGIVGSLIAGLVANPVLLWFGGTQAAIAIYVYFVARQGWMRWPKTVVAGVGLGVVALLVSVPVIVVVFGGSTGKIMLFNNVITELADKTLQCVIAVALLRILPASTR